MSKKVFVSGCYDMLHSGHVAFFEEAAQYGDVYVGVGSDKTIRELKARKTVHSDIERLYMIKALKTVKDAWINSGSGLLDFEADVEKLMPDIFFVNSDGHSPAKERFCQKHGIEYIVRERVPHPGLPVRSSTAIRSECLIPYRIDLAGGWLDQPYVNKYCPGAVITVCIEPDYEFNDRSGMATSSRKKAVELWQTDIPDGDRELFARTLFCYENPPGTRYVSGSQDALGIVMPGLNRFYYTHDYWPDTIESRTDHDLLSWIEQHLWLVALFPRMNDYDVLSDTRIDKAGAMALSAAADACWEALLNKDAVGWGKASIASFEAQIKMFPNMLNEDVKRELNGYQSDVSGWKLSGAGGGGYLVFISEKPVKNAIRIRIRRERMR